MHSMLLHAQTLLPIATGSNVFPRIPHSEYMYSNIYSPMVETTDYHFTAEIL